MCRRGALARCGVARRAAVGRDAAWRGGRVRHGAWRQGAARRHDVARRTIRQIPDGYLDEVSCGSNEMGRSAALSVISPRNEVPR